MGYLQATKTVKIDQDRKNIPTQKDVIIYQTKETSIDTPEGRLIKKTYKKKNISRIMNETKKLVKGNTASEKLAEIEKIFTK